VIAVWCHRADRLQVNHMSWLGVELAFQFKAGSGRVARAVSEAAEQSLRQDDLSCSGAGLKA
jgi:hypothetical protein